MKILQLTKSFPFPLLDGASWAVINMARGLRDAGASLDLVSLNTDKHYADADAVGELNDLSIYDDIRLFDISIKPNIFSAVKNLFSTQSYHVARFDQRDVRYGISDLIESGAYDIVLVESVYMMNFISLEWLGRIRTCRLIVRPHNVEYLIWERYSERLSGLTAWYYRKQSARLKLYESEMLAYADTLLPVSELDVHIIKERLAPDVRVYSVPIAMDPLPLLDLEPEDRPVIFGFIGSLDWRPNIEGLQWFVDKIWPRIQSLDFESVLMIAGRNPDDSFKLSSGSSVTLIGEIEDSDTFLRRIDYLISPLFSGSGTRVKILQSFRVGTPVIASALACEGLSVNHGDEVILADTEHEWVAACEQVLDVSKRQHLRIRGQKYLEANHDVRTLGRKVWKLLKELKNQN